MKQLSFKKPHVVLVLFAMGFLFSFQNCSQQYGVSTQDPTSNGPKYDYYEVDLSQRTSYPPLKMVFVVDNSNTMRANQIQLSKSFGSMFSGSDSSNLTPYDTEVFLLSTAQVNGTSLASSFKATELPLMGGDTIPLNTLSFAQFNSSHRGNMLSGRIAGDIIGFRTIKDQVGAVKQMSFEPAPVLGLGDAGNQAFTKRSIRKAANQSADSLRAEFSNRLSLLDPKRNIGLTPKVVGNTVYGQFDPVIDKESGLCALARTLNKPQGFFQKGDLVSFAVISDEDEAFVSGEQCLSKTETQPKGNLIDAQCMIRTGVYKNDVSYAVRVPEHFKTTITRQETFPGSCQVDFRNGVNVQYQRINKTVKTKVSYFVDKSSTQCFGLQTQVSFYTVGESCTERDGIRQCEPVYSSTAVPQTVSGDFSASKGLCTAQNLKSALPGNAVLDNANYPFSCDANAVRVSVNSTTSDCVVTNTTDSKSTILTGDFSIASGLCNQAGLKSVLEVGTVFDNATKPLVCDPNPTIEYPLAAVENISLKISEAQTLGVGLNASNNSVCPQALVQAKLPNLSLASCTISWTTGQQKPNFEQGENCATIAQNICGSSNGDLTNCAGVALSAPGIKNVDSVITAATALTCDSECKGSSLCHSAGLKKISQHFLDTNSRSIAGTCVVKTAGVFVDAKIESRTETKDESSALTCNSVCKGTNYCNSAGTAVVSSYLSQAYDGVKGSYPPANVLYQANSCQVVATEKLEQKKFTYAAETFDVSKACPNGSLIQNYKNASGVAVSNPSSPYLNPEENDTNTFVSGGVNSPAQDLISYIRTRASELFGTIAPVTTVFVRQPADGNGVGGSVGVNYNRFADVMSGSKESVMSSDYSPALQRLSYSIKERINRSIVVPGLNEAKIVTRVWRKNREQSTWAEQLRPDQYSFSGNTVFISDKVPLSGRDLFRIEFY